jgi:hypothetical protein
MEEQIRTYASLTAKHGGFARFRFGTPDIATSPSGFVASAHTFRVHPDIDPHLRGGPTLTSHSPNPLSWTVGPTAGGGSRDLWPYVDIESENFTVPLTLSVQFTLKETWAGSFTHTRAVWETWEEWMGRLLAGAPEGLKDGFQTSDVRSNEEIDQALRPRSQSQFLENICSRTSLHQVFPVDDGEVSISFVECLRSHVLCIL